MRCACKTAAFIVFIATYLAGSLFISVLARDKQRIRRWRASITSRFCRILLPLLGIKLSVQSRERVCSGTGRLILANHLSYVDVLVIAALIPSIFITSFEVMHSPIEGLLAKCGGSMFVDRRSKANISRDIRTAAELLSRGFTVVLFPEATSSSGERVLPFKSSLMQAAFETKAEIIPACINYVSIDRKPISTLTRDSVFYYGNMCFFNHFLGLLRLSSIQVELSFLEGIRAKTTHRKSAAALAYRSISNAFIAIH
jgi:lyso-ornithine lipid O-acyltransferase